MSVLVVGLSHKGAPLATLERVALTGDALDKLLHDVARADDVAGALVLSTCNRVEIYAEVGKFHGAVAAICELLSRHSQVPLAELTACLYVHYEDRAVQHLLAVACGLDSMVIGESQILGQLRQALHAARQQGTLGRTLSDLGTLALRAGKRTRAETKVGAAGASLVSVGLQAAARHLAGGPPEAGMLAGRRVLVVGAGSMSGLTVASVARAGAAALTVASRTRHRAERLAASAGGQAADMSDLVDLIAAADLVVTCTGASGHVISADTVVAALDRRSQPRGAPLVLLDLAMPRDVDPDVGSIDGVVLTDLDALAGDDQAGLRPGDAEVAEVRRIMADELAAHLSANRAAAVTPTVVALRAKAAGVVDAELARLAGRLDLDPVATAEVQKSMRRVTDKLLHDPTVRVKELAGSPGGDTYEDALRVLFDLDPATVQAVAQADADLAGWPQPIANREDGR
ncbi:MAG TPA: glutamyl-tRNA reductase [Streptosporangiaceae bacterium]|nr:glutamyl-tRNA reductase [Streptosporangiaceae bacterium]